MRLLFLTHRVPYPPDRGDRIRSFHLLKFLAERADVSLACPTEEPVSNLTRNVLGGLCSEVAIRPTSAIGRGRRAATSLALGRSATEGYYWHPRLADAIRRWARSARFDAIVCYCSGMYRYTQLAELAGVPLLVDLVDVDSQKWADCACRARFSKRWLYRLESSRVRRLETEIANRASTVTLVSEEERELFHAVDRSSSAHVVANGVDLDFYSRQPGSPAVEPRTCCFVGVLNYPPNVDGLKWFVEGVWPAVRAEMPGARFLIVGKSPEASVERMTSVPGVELHANVPDVRPFLAQSAISVSPMQFSRGVQNKVLEAMAMKKAVVATPQSLEGLRARAGVELVVASDVQEWSSAILGLMKDSLRVEQLGSAARTYVESEHRWETCLSPLADRLRDSTEHPRRESDRPAQLDRRIVKAAS